MDIYKRKSKKYLSIILTLALVITSISMPGVTKTVYATGGEAKAPTTGTYLAKADFTSGSFNDTYGLATDSQIAKKVYFGASGTDLEWWMAGVEDVTGGDISATTLVLFSSKVLSGTVAYNTPSDLANYASSYIHNTVLNNLLSSRFSTSEQEAIVPVTLGYKGYATSQTEIESMTVTNCKLYLPDADGTNFYDSAIIKVGQSNFEVKKNYWYSDLFWLRSADSSGYGDYGDALIADSGSVGYGDVEVDNTALPVPACNVNLTSVLFSSAAPAAASTDADLTSGTIMTLRFASNKTVTGSDCKDRIQSSAVAYKDKVKIENPTNTEFLYVQWNDGTKDRVKSIELDSQNEIKASDICTDSNFELNDSCKIWLEKKVDNITYAKNVEFSNKQETALTVTSSSLKVAEGEDVDITVSTEGECAGIEAVLEYNKRLFTIKNIEKMTGDDIVTGTDASDTNLGTVTYKKIGDKKVIASGALFKVTFTAEQDVAIDSNGDFSVSGSFTKSQEAAAEDAEIIPVSTINVAILKAFKTENKPIAASPTAVKYDGNSYALFNAPEVPVTNSTIIYSYTKDNTIVTSTKIPTVSNLGEYTDVKYTISANGYKTYTSEPISFKIDCFDYEVELISDYVSGKALILVYTNADTSKVNVKYAGKSMYRMENSGYTVSGSDVTYTNVYGITADNSSGTNLNIGIVKGKITFINGTSNKSIECGNKDVNGTGKKDISDAVAAMGVYNINPTYFAGKEDFWDKIILKADVDHNKKVDTEDVTLVLLAN